VRKIVYQNNIIAVMGVPLSSRHGSTSSPSGRLSPTGKRMLLFSQNKYGILRRDFEISAHDGSL
jgi:hypothetical protein